MKERVGDGKLIISIIISITVSGMQPVFWHQNFVEIPRRRATNTIRDAVYNVRSKADTSQLNLPHGWG